MCDVEKLASLKMHKEEIYTYNIHNVYIYIIYHLVDFLFPYFLTMKLLEY